MFSYVSAEQRVPKDHPLREIRPLVDEVLRDMSRAFEGLYARVGRRRSARAPAAAEAPSIRQKDVTSMKSMIVIGLLAMTPNFIAIGQVKNARAVTDAKAEQEIRLVEDKRREALLRGDTTTLDQIFADDYSVVNQFGQVQTKAQMMSALKSSALKFESVVEEDVSTRVYGDAAVLSGRSTSKHEGKESTQLRFTRVYVKRQGHWQTVAYQVTRMAQQ